MAYIETWYRCPVCNKSHGKQHEAIKCRDSHPIKSEKWAVGKGGKSVRIYDNCSLNGYGGLNWALKEADLSDLIEERKQQLEQRE